jgi:hypothetical protein
MTDSAKESVHIYLNSAAATEKVFGTGDASASKEAENYIILQNDTLQAEDRKLRYEAKANEMRIEELEEDADRTDKGRVYMKGLLKNLVELDKLRKKHSSISKSLFDQQAKHIVDVKRDSYKELLGLGVILLVVFTAFLFSGNWSTAFLFGILSVGDIMSKNFILSKISAPTGKYKGDIIELNGLNTQIKIITDAQDFVHEYMDGL